MVETPLAEQAETHTEAPGLTSADLPAFVAELGQVRQQMSSATYWRWTQGRLGSSIEFLLAHPRLLLALHRDALALSRRPAPRASRPGRPRRARRAAEQPTPTS